MQLNHPKAVKQFLENGILATLRIYPYEVGHEIEVNGDAMPPNVYAKVIKVLILVPDAPYDPEEEQTHLIERPRITKEFIADSLYAYLKMSGFDSVEEWYKAALELHGKPPKRIVIIQKYRGF